MDGMDYIKQIDDAVGMCIHQMTDITLSMSEDMFVGEIRETVFNYDENYKVYRDENNKYVVFKPDLSRYNIVVIKLCSENQSLGNR